MRQGSGMILVGELPRLRGGENKKCRPGAREKMQGADWRGTNINSMDRWMNGLIRSLLSTLAI